MRLIVGAGRFAGGLRAGIVCCCCLLLPLQAGAATAGKGSPEIAGREASDPLDIDGVTAKIAELEAIQAPDLKTRTALESYQGALATLQEARRETEEFLRLKQVIDGAGKSKAEIEASLELVRGAIESPPVISDEWTLLEIQQRLDQALADREVVKNRLVELEASLANERLRPAQTGKEIAAVKAQLTEVEGRLRAPEVGAEGDRTGEARRTALLAGQHLSKSRLDRLEMERLSHGPRLELLNLQIDLQREILKQADQSVQVHQGRLADKRIAQAEQALVETAEVRRKVLGKHPILEQIAGDNQALGGELGLLTAKLRTATAVKERLTGREALISKNLERARQQLDIVEIDEAVGEHDKTIGELLRAQRSELPDTKQLERAAAKGHREMARVRLKQFKVEDQRQALRDTAEGPGEGLRKRPEGVDDEEWAQIIEQIRNLESDQLALLDKLQATYGRYEKVLADADLVRIQLIDRIHEYATLLDRHLVWLPSADPLELREFVVAGRSLADYVAGDVVSALGEGLLSGMSGHPVLALGLSGVLLFLFLSRGRMRREIDAASSNVGNVTRDTFLSTMKVALNTLLLTAPWPLLLVGTGWLLKQGGSPIAEAVGAGLYRASVYVMLLQFLRYLFMPGGLAEGHFKWPGRVVRLLRGNLPWFLAITAPAAYVIGFSEVRPVDLHPEAISRVAVLVGVIALGFFAHRILNPWTGITRPSTPGREGALSLKAFWYFAVMGLILFLLGLEVEGYYYTARRLFYLIVASLWAGICVLLLYSLFERWLLVAERRLALRRARERRQAAREARAAREAAEAAGESVQEALELNEINLDEINEQSRRLLRFAGVALLLTLLAMVWSELVPALGVLDEHVLWQYSTEVSGEAQLIPVSVSDVGFALIVFILTFIAGSNVPGLLEISILQPLRLEPGVRFTISRVSSYLIFTGGTLFAIGILGVRWGDVQWLVAAMGVGLGFGLQEVFANFISGLMILFERPMRIGDTVTVGNVSGTVTRFRTRATTITDWDNKELVVPNKAFITDHLINWTLSDPITRLVIPLGIAYGSDTDKAYEIMMDVVSEHPDVLEEPNPTVFFVGFGESSLDFEIRVFVRERLMRMPLTHDLHMALNRRLQQENIEIPFPQRDLHIRSVDPSVVDRQRESGGEPGGDR